VLDRSACAVAATVVNDGDGDDGDSNGDWALASALRGADARAAQLAADEAAAHALAAREEREASARLAARRAEDAGGRDVLTEVRASIPSFLSAHGQGLAAAQGVAFDVASLATNPHSSPGADLYERFLAAWTETDMKVRLCFHGTPEANIGAIFREGLDPKRRAGQAFGAGEYFGATAAVSVPYCRGGSKMIVFAVLTDPSGITLENTQMVVVHKPEHQLPLASVSFRQGDPRRVGHMMPHMMPEAYGLMGHGGAPMAGNPFHAAMAALGSLQGGQGVPPAFARLAAVPFAAVPYGARAAAPRKRSRAKRGKWH
jgi:hypothetical protein